MKRIQYFLLFSLLAGLLACNENEQKEAIAWHGIERSVRYVPDGGDFVIMNGNRRFNRALYGTNTAFRIEAGDLPEFALYLPGMGGNLKFAIRNGEESKWLIEAEEIEARYRPGSMLYTISDPLLGKETLKLHLLAHPEGEALILRIELAELAAGSELYWVYGGASGKRFSRNGDLGADPESSFYLKPEYCMGNEYEILEGGFQVLFGPEKDRRGNPIAKKQIQGLLPPGSSMSMHDADQQDNPGQLLISSAGETPLLAGSIADSDAAYFMIGVPGNEVNNIFNSITYDDLPGLFQLAEESRQELAGRIKVTTPDPYINTMGAALSIAADAVWQEPAYLHGAVAWRNHLVGWRGAYIADWLGWHDRAKMQFREYAKSQYTSPAFTAAAPDPKTNLSRQIEKAGYSLFSEGYISRRPGQINPPHHYDMNLVYIDQLLWHFNWNGDLEFSRELWPVIERHLAWEKQCFDMDGDGLYNAYCCIWASDALQYSGGGVTHSTAYNYRGNLLAARLASMIGEDPSAYLVEAERIKNAVEKDLWMPEKGWYAEYKDQLGLQLLHPTPALWTIYHALDAALPDPFQAYQSLRYIDNEIPHIPMIVEGMEEEAYFTLATSTWMPYTWSINNVALAENLHTSLAYWQGGRKEKAFQLWKSQFIESMYNGGSPGNFQQLSFYDAFRGELYRDFADPIGMAARSLVEGLFGIVPDALAKDLLIRPGLPDQWEHASLETPDIKFSYKREGLKDSYLLDQDLPVQMNLRLQVKARSSSVEKVTVNGQSVEWKHIQDAVGYPLIEITSPAASQYDIRITWADKPLTELDEYLGTLIPGDSFSKEYESIEFIELYDPQDAVSNESLTGSSLHFNVEEKNGQRTVFARVKMNDMSWWHPFNFEISPKVLFEALEDSTKNQLKLIVHNQSQENMEGILLLNGIAVSPLKVPGNSHSKVLTLNEHLVPGTNSLEFFSEEGNYKGSVQNWNISAGDSMHLEMVELKAYFNDEVDRIFKNLYLSPRAESPTLQIPIQGIGDWCTYAHMPEIDDQGIRKRAAREGSVNLSQGIPFSTSSKEHDPNILYTSKWDNYPDSASVALSGSAKHAYFLMTGSAHHMQSRMVNGKIVIHYTDGSSDSLLLEHPHSWWPIEQDYYQDGFAFTVKGPKPPRILLKSGDQQVGDYEVWKKNGTNEIDGGAATVYDLVLDPEKELEELQLITLCNDIVIGLMSVTLMK